MIKKILSNKCNMLFFGINLVVIIELLYQYSILDSIYLIGVDTLLIIYTASLLFTYKSIYLVSAKYDIFWYTALDKTVAPLSNAGVYVAFKADILVCENIKVMSIL